MNRAFQNSLTMVDTPLKEVARGVAVAIGEVSGPGYARGLKPWQAYAVAVIATVVTLGLRLMLDKPLGGQPTLVIFTLPIMLSAYLGGLRGGLLATVLSYFLASYYLLPPIYSFGVASGAECWQQFFVALAGVVISLLNEALHRSRRRVNIAMRGHQASEEDRNRFFVLSQDLLCILGFDGLFKELNPAWEKALGYTRAEILATPFIEFIHPDDRAGTLAQAANVAAGNSLTAFENRYRCKDGSYRCFQWNVTPAAADGVMYGVARDIKDRNGIEATLREGEERFRTLANSIPQLAWIARADGSIEWYNQRWYDYTGTTPAAMEGWGWQSVHDFNRLQEVMQRWGAAIASGQPFEMEFPLRAANGRFRNFLTRVQPLKDSQGRVAQWFGTNTDVEALKQAEDTARKSEAQLQAIVENINEAVVVSDLKGQLLHFNHAALEMLGYASIEEGRRHFSELAGTHELEGLDGVTWPVEQWPLARILRGEKLHDIEARMRRTGTEWERVFSFGGTLANDAGGKPLMAVVTFTDITDRKQAETAALQLAAIVESSADAVIGKDLRSIVTSWNDAAERMFGYSAAEMVGRPITRIIPENHRDDEALILSHIKRGERVEHFETERIKKDGTLIFISVTVSPIKDAQGRVIGASKLARDITGRKRIEIELRESEERFRLLVVGVREYAIILLDRDGLVVSWNAGAERLSGYKAEEIIGKSLSVFYPPEDVAAGKPALELEAAAQRGKLEDEGWRVRSDGTRFWANVLITALKDDAGSLRGFSKLTRDTTERKQAEEALLKAGALQRAIFNSANFSSIATDGMGVVQIFNVGAERMLGYSAAEVMNRITPADISDPLEVVARAQALSLELGTPIKPGFEALAFKASRGIEDIYELTYIRKDGSRVPAVVSVTALRDARAAIIGYLLIGTDNTARKQAEAALLEAGALQRAIFESANFSSIATDARGVIQIFNVGAEQMLGYSASEVLNNITPADISDSQELIDRAQALSEELGTCIAPGFDALVFKASRGIEDIYQLTYVRKDGSRFPALVSVTALRDGQDAIIGYLLIGTDNTARMEAEGKISRWNVELEQRIADRTSELAETNSDLEAFTYSVSHDLRAPLRAIDGFSRILQSEHAAALPPEANRFLGLVRTNVQQMGQLLEDLLSLCRHSRQTIEAHTVQLDSIAQQVWQDLTQWPSERRIRFEAAKLEPCVGDPALLRQVLVNLLSNALKFTATRDETQIFFGAETNNAGETVFYVKDNGIGFDMRYVHKLFGVFQRLHRAEDYAGTGVGLAIVQRIIKRHGGRVWAESEPDKGTTISFTLGSEIK